MCNTLLAILTTCNLAAAPAPAEVTPAIVAQAQQSLAYAMHAFVYPPSVEFFDMGCNFPVHKSPRKGQIIGEIACEAITGTYTVTTASAPRPVSGCTEPMQLSVNYPLTVQQTCGQVIYTMEISPDAS